MADFVKRDEKLVYPGSGAFSITPSDATVFAEYTRGLYVGVSGNVAVKMADGTTVTFTNLAAGIVHPLRVQQVLATGTTATGVIGVI